jgi:cytochrome c oxidase subunit 2
MLSIFLSFEIPFFPDAASTTASQIDAIYAFLVAVSAVMTLLIFAGVFTFAMKYRRKSEHEIPKPIHGSLRLEIAWSVLPLLVMLVMFFWGAKVYFDNATPPANAMDVYVVGKQWMWKVQYPDGQREINELHVPVGQPVKLTMSSEDVIHSFFIPAFRVKHDVVPGRPNYIWFTPTKPGRYRLFCAEYCGTEHSGMIGWVTVMNPSDYENWLSGGGAEGSMASQGEKLFQQLGCSTCHLLDEQGRCPIMRNVYGSRVLLQDGRTVVADDAYIRESILNPNAKIVSGFKSDVMPTFQGQVSEEQILQLIVYIKSLAAKKIGAIGVAETGTQSGRPRGGPADTRAGQGTTAAQNPGAPEATNQAVRRNARTDEKK